MLGETNPRDSKPGTIRGDFCIQVSEHFIFARNIGIIPLIYCALSFLY